MKTFLIVLALLVSPAFADGHWELVGTPQTQQGVGHDHATNGTGLFADALVTADGDKVTASGTGCGSSLTPQQSCTSKGGKYFEAYTWVGTGTGYVHVQGEVDIGATGDATNGGAGRLYGYTQMKSSLTDELLSEANLSVTTGGAGKLGGVTLKGPKDTSINLPVLAPGSLDHDHQVFDPPANPTVGEDCAIFFWHQRRTYGYVEVLVRGTLVSNGTCAINLNGTVTSSPALGGPCDGSKETVPVPCTCVTCTQMNTLSTNVTVCLLTTIFF